MVPHMLSQIRMNDTGPLAEPPVVRTASSLGLSLLKEKPVPPPLWWIKAVFLTASNIDSSESSTGITKQAASCWSWRPAFIRVGELGRQPRTARKFFDKYQDRIMFGTDAVPDGYETPQQVFGDQLYEIYYRFLETEDEYFDYAPSPVPPQGRWRIYGINMPDQVLRKVYNENAARLLRMGQERVPHTQGL